MTIKLLNEAAAYVASVQEKDLTAELLTSLETATKELEVELKKLAYTRKNHIKVSHITLPANTKWIPGYEGRYTISTEGILTSYIREESPAVIKPCFCEANGYYNVVLHYYNGAIKKQKSYTVSRLLAATFLGLDLADRSQCVDHLNSLRLDNRLANLEVVSFSENIKRGKQNKMNQKKTN